MSYNPLPNKIDPFNDNILSIEQPVAIHRDSFEEETIVDKSDNNTDNNERKEDESTIKQDGNLGKKKYNDQIIGSSSSDHNELSLSDDEELDQFDPISFKHSQNEEEDIDEDNRSTTDDYEDDIDDYGNHYNINFNNKNYTKNLKFKGNKLVYFTSAFVSLFVGLFGYEQGVCSGILAFDTFNRYFHDPSAATIGVVISILEIGAMISSILVAKISDNFGRKRTILLGTFIFMIGGTLQSFCPNMFVFAVGRVFSGIGVGILSTIVPSYQCEISPSEERGKLVCGEFTGNISGYALSVWVDYFCYFIQDIGDTRQKPHSFLANLSWRLPLFVQVVLALILLIGGFFIVESPRWLLDNDMDQQGFNVLSLLYDSHQQNLKPKIEFFLIKNSIIKERKLTPKHERTWKHLFLNYKRRIFVACSSLIFAQFNGINIISYYAPLVFLEAGFNHSGALLMTGINGIIYLLSTIPPWFLVDKWGRRPILITSGLAMGLCLTLVSVFMLLDKNYTPVLVAILVIIYNASFGFGFGPIPFLLSGESYPLSVRSKGVSLAVSCNWLSNFIVGLFAPILKQNIKWAMYLFPAGSCIISVICVILFYPETKGIELEQIDEIFNDFYSINPINRIIGSFQKIGLRRRKNRKNKKNKIKDKQSRRLHAKYNRLDDHDHNNFIVDDDDDDDNNNNDNFNGGSTDDLFSDRTHDVKGIELDNLNRI
ncbi:uncharacterized protein KGF55_000416 [Candida pseudojiufengensis]|uniref:uncharacterized protein n=1 Tax=Candida pseudojiufengensis TaxID=497109 RepID=UPI002224DC68|nr:uncharacterized protein KGF55_000416 [Candida pseudojiufengensis]KAI5967006.1 hypothetical protein KGF55_000416 [Candida pseudojiufengensis]